MAVNTVLLKLAAVFCLVVNVQYASTKFYKTPVYIRKIVKTLAPLELQTLVLPKVNAVDSSPSLISVPAFKPYSSHVESPANVYGPPQDIKKVFNEVLAKTEQIVNVPPPTELPPLKFSEITPTDIIDKSDEGVSVHTPVVFGPYPPPLGIPAEVYGPPLENKEVFNEPPEEIKEIVNISPPPELPPFKFPEISPTVIVNKPVEEIVNVPPPPELPPFKFPEIPPTVIVDKPVEVVSVHTPVAFGPYPPPSGTPAEVYEPPQEIKEVFDEPPVEIKEIVNVPPPPELPPFKFPEVPPTVIVEKPVEVVSVHTPVEFGPYPPPSGTPAEVYGPPQEIKEVFDEPLVEIKEIVNVPPPPELPPFKFPEIPPTVIVDKPIEVVSVHTPVEFGPYPPPSGTPAEVYGPPQEIKEVFDEPLVEIKEIVNVPPPPELPPFKFPEISPAVIVDKPVEEIKEVFDEPLVEIKEIVNVPPPPELPPFKFPEIPPTVIVDKPVEVVSVHTPVEFGPYPPPSGTPAEVYGPPVEIKKVYDEPPVEVKETVSVSPPPELPSSKLPEIPPAVVDDKPIEVVAVHSPMEFALYRPHSGTPAELYGPPMEIKEFLNVASYPELSPLLLPAFEEKTISSPGLFKLEKPNTSASDKSKLVDLGA
ncbi:hypothetical protein EVAR_81317_1 [Eumeta japonica]|uniref:Uncharacterized protein n=1 Tax=Eumeta variegata TaxID=151549 RepID=A0A4C1W1H6_EUMVA|nr:hypothetical protein EVAR_81317_1 [Eumeta japonica]